MKILNPKNIGDFHIHSINYSDGFNTVDEITIQAGKIGLKKIAISDHSQACLDYKGFKQKSFRLYNTNIVKRWQNIHNNVEVMFGVEGDILDEKGNVCIDIQGVEGEFVLLGMHRGIYEGKLENVTEAFIAAIQKNKGKIDCISHPCIKKFSEYLDIKKLIKICNEEEIPLEFNCVNLIHGKTDTEKLKILLTEADKIYINSDAHTLYELTEARKFGFKYLKENGFI